MDKIHYQRIHASTRILEFPPKLKNSVQNSTYSNDEEDKVNF